MYSEWLARRFFTPELENVQSNLAFCTRVDVQQRALHTEQKTDGRTDRQTSKTRNAAY